MEPNYSQFTKLRLYVDLDTNKLRVSDVSRYPYALGLQAKEVDIVHNDITKGDEQGNNSRDLFMEPLGNFNLEFTEECDQITAKKNRVLPLANK